MVLGLNISKEIYDQLEARDKRALAKMAKELSEADKRTMFPITSVSDVEDWIAEWREEGHIL
jgi:TRAP-type C4-dicarboxylate transport system substrate-binding protein